ncbi:MAG: Branched-chain amino acid transport ATP-binding protein LivG, partial [Gemmatimonadales bacterium]|nr:Branched-chain amino acid transport ATP-binding protein LivG [Gemmatimonadales bacterium]
GVLLIEHNVPLVLETCDRIVVLDFGKVIAEGDPETIRKNNTVITAYLGGDLMPAEQDAQASLLTTAEDREGDYV